MLEVKKKESKLKVQEKNLIICEDSKITQDFFDKINSNNNKFINNELKLLELIGNDQGFKSKVVQLIKKHFRESLGEYTIASYNDYIDKCICVIDLDIFEKGHKSNKDINDLNNIIDYLSNIDIKLPNGEQLKIDFILLPTYPDISSLLIPYYLVDFDYFNKIKCGQIEYNCDCKISKNNDFDKYMSGTCCVCILHNEFNSEITKSKTKIKDILEIEKKTIFDNIKLPKAIEKHRQRVKSIYNTDNLNMFNVKHLRNLKLEELKLFQHHSCLSLLFEYK